ncbi:MAG: response regulator [Gammaproteobacteria bacterium]|nr:response regulator [Gammaproteobacteria bacterium]
MLAKRASELKMTNSDENRQILLTPNEAAKILHVSPVTIRHWALAGKIDYVTTPGGHRRFRPSDIKRFSQRNSQVSENLSFVVLIVEDDAQHAGFLADLVKLHSDTYEAKIALNGFDAANCLHKSTPDLILMDIAMPGLDGVSVCQYIKQIPEYRHIPIIAMTGYAVSENQARVVEAGAECCISKPINGASLMQKIDHHRNMAERR